MSSTIRQRLTLRSIRGRLTFWYLLTLGLAMLGFAAFVWLVRARTLYNELDAGLEIQGRQLAAELQSALLDLDPGAELARHPRAPSLALSVRAARGTVLYRSPVFPLVDWAGERDLAAAARSGDRSFVTVSDRARLPVRVVTFRVDRPGAEPLAMQIAGPTTPVRRVLGQLAGTMAAAIVLVLLIAAYGSSLTARHALAPVDAIVARVRQVQTAGPAGRVDVPGGSAELDRLVATLNDMLDRIEASLRSAKRFAADASHELQTPLTAMRSAVDAALRCPDGARDFRLTAADLLAEIDRCSVLVRDLRLLALAEAGQVVAAPESVDVSAVVEECSDIARAIAEPRRIRVKLLIDGRPVVTGSAAHLRRAILNLADNAVRYSADDTTVYLAVATSGGEATVTVRDQGYGIGPSDLPHVFEPFYRTDPARARDTGGTGLGLAIADQIVRAHGGRIHVSSTLGVGSTFTVSLPTAPRA